MIYTGTGKSTVQYSTRGRHSRIIGIFYSREMVSVQVQYRTYCPCTYSTKYGREDTLINNNNFRKYFVSCIFIFLCTVGHTSETHSVHVYTLNGRHLASADIQHRVTGNFINKKFKTTFLLRCFKC